MAMLTLDELFVSHFEIGVSALERIRELTNKNIGIDRLDIHLTKRDHSYVFSPFVASFELVEDRTRIYDVTSSPAHPVHLFDIPHLGRRHLEIAEKPNLEHKYSIGLCGEVISPEEVLKRYQEAITQIKETFSDYDFSDYDYGIVKER